MKRPYKVLYDASEGTAYVQWNALEPGEAVTRTQRMSDYIQIDNASDGLLVGIELRAFDEKTLSVVARIARASDCAFPRDLRGIIETERDLLRRPVTPNSLRREHEEPNVTADGEVMSGTPCFTGTRVPVGVLFENLADGSTLDEILADWPTLTRARAVAVLQEAQEALERDAISAVLVRAYRVRAFSPRRIVARRSYLRKAPPHQGSPPSSTPNPPPDPSTAVSPSTSIGYENLSWLPRLKKK
jgi:uncharacterized protein (DUF433 family)/uncharacterized protein YuzE